MLVLSRTENQRVFIGDDVIVTVVASGGGRVRLGFEAPERIKIHREEVHKDIQLHGEREHVTRTG